MSFDDLKIHTDAEETSVTSPFIAKIFDLLGI
jgi:hypothetical protein